MTPEGEKPYVHDATALNEHGEVIRVDCPPCLAREAEIERLHAELKRRVAATAGRTQMDGAENERLRRRLREYEEGLRRLVEEGELLADYWLPESPDRLRNMREATAADFLSALRFARSLLSTPQPETETR